MTNENNFFTRNIDMTWKTFVRASSNNPEELPEKKEHRLGFQGNEARDSYEEIINQESNANLRFKSFNHCKRKTQNCTALKPVIRTEKAKESQKFHEKVTINTILRAIEQRDLKFLWKHVTQENVNLTDNFGWTPLMLAAYHGYLDITEFLLHLGANREVKEKSGLTAAQLALKKNYLNIVALLKRKTETNKYLLETRIDMEVPNAHTCTDSIKPSKNYNATLHTSTNNGDARLKESAEFYCEICEMNFCQTSWKKHETSVLHIFNTKPKLPNAMYGISKQNKGYQMLLNTGWNEQCGLGPLGNGTKYPVKTCLKTDRKGFDRSNEKEYRITHFKPGDTAAVDDVKMSRQTCLKKKDIERLLHRENKKERTLRIALS